MNNKQLIEMAAARLDCSAWKLAQKIGIRSDLIYRAKSGKKSLSEQQVIQICKLIKLDPATVLPGIVAERTNDPEKKRIWQRVAQLAARGASTLSAVFILAPALLHGFEHYILC